MVVLKDRVNLIRKKFGEEAISRWRDFSFILGYSLSADDEVKIELNPDRPDLFSFATLNRASEVYYGFVKPNDIKFTRSSDSVIFKKSAMNLRPYFTVFEAAGSDIGDHLDDLIDYQEKLHESIGKGRKKVSIGIHDRTMVRFPITYQGMDSNNTSFTTYDGFNGTAAQILKTHPRGSEYGNLIKSDTHVPIISDDNGNVLSMPPIVNGSTTKVERSSDKFLVDITGTETRAVRSAAWMLANYFSTLGYQISLPKVKYESRDMFTDWWKEYSVRLSSSTVNAVIGVSVQAKDAVKNLRRMGLIALDDTYPLQIRVPGFRDDIMGEVDIIEDLAKSIRYSEIPERSISLPLSGMENAMNEFSDMIRTIFIGAGFQEVMTFVVGAPALYKEFELHSSYEIMNPKSTDFSFIRTALYPGLLDFLKHNKSRGVPQRIFEIGRVVVADKERMNACLMIIGPRTNYATIKSVADAVIQRISGTTTEVISASIAAIIDGRGGNLLVNEENVGIIGEIHPKHLDFFELNFPACFIELDLNALIRSSRL
ncbi:MAG: phenylalanine--tRNA ligase subunit beta [Thermoplasmata archaeon]